MYKDTETLVGNAEPLYGEEGTLDPMLHLSRPTQPKHVSQKLYIIDNKKKTVKNESIFMLRKKTQQDKKFQHTVS